MYRNCVAAMIFDINGKILVGERVDFPSFQMPQGGVDTGENVTSAILRELYEELGITDCEIVVQSQKKRRYNFPSYIKMDNFIGQEQTWFLVFLKDKSQINLKISSHQEFSTWKFVTLEEVVELSVDFKRDIYESIAKEFQKEIEKYISKINSK